MLAVVCACTAVKNCAFVVIQLSACDAGGRGDATGHRLGGVDVACTVTSMLDTPPAQAEQALRRAQGDVGRALVGALVAEVEDAGHRERVVGAVGRRDAQLVADGHAQVAGQFGADQDVAARSAACVPRTILSGSVDDPEIELGVDADQRDRRGSRRRAPPAPSRSPPATPRSTSGIARICGDHGLPLVDRLQALQRRLHDRIFDAPPGRRAGSARATSFGGSSWMCGCAVSTRRTKLACSPASSADMKTITATPIATPLTMNTRLHASLAQEAQRHDPLERQPGFTGRRGRGRRLNAASRPAAGGRARRRECPWRSRRRRVAGLQPAQHLAHAAAAQAESQPADGARALPSTLSTQGRGAVGVVHGVGRNEHGAGPRRPPRCRPTPSCPGASSRAARRRRSLTSTEPRCASTPGLM